MQQLIVVSACRESEAVTTMVLVSVISSVLLGQALEQQNVALSLSQQLHLNLLMFRLTIVTP